MSNLFRSLWMKEFSNFPMLMMACPQGSGKNTFMTLFLQWCGMPGMKPTTLGALTETGLFTPVNRYCDLPVWFDEFKNNIKPWILDLLKGNADGSKKTVGSLDVYTAKSREHRTGLMLTEEFRATDTALNQRYPLVNLT